MKVTRVDCTFSDSAVGVGTGGGGWCPEEDEEEPFMSIGCWGTSAMPLSGRETSTAVSRHAAFSWVNQSVRCSNLQPAIQRLSDIAFLLMQRAMLCYTRYERWQHQKASLIAYSPCPLPEAVT